MNVTPSTPPAPTRWEHAILRVPGLRSAALPQPSPRVFAPHRALWLAAECLGLKAMLIAAQTRITALEEWQRAAEAQHSRDAEKIADLHRRNGELTRALHRTACAG